jgi:hypothetical protein
MKAYPAILLFLSISAHAATIVPSEENLRAAIATENVVLFTSSGTIKLNETIEINGDITIDGSGVTIEIDGQEAHSLFKVNTDQRLTLRNLTLANGRNIGRQGIESFVAGGHGTGGAIQNLGGILIVENCVFRNNSAIGGKPYGSADAGCGMGGAIFQNAGQLMVTNCTFSGNFARGGAAGAGSGGWARGGAIYGVELVTVSATDFLDNYAEGGIGGVGPAENAHALGGAIYGGYIELIVERCAFRANHAKGGLNAPADGGAIMFHSTSVTITDSVFTDNFSIGGPAAGGGLGNIGKAGRGGAILTGWSTGSLSVSGSTFDGNYTRGGQNLATGTQPVGSGPALGGAIFLNAGSGADIQNSTLHANAALSNSPTNTASGGAIESEGQLTMSHVTIANNASLGPTINSIGRAFLKAVIAGTNQANQNFSGDIIDMGYNLSSDNSPAFTDPRSANKIDAKLGRLGDFGGPTPTMPILLGSPAIDRVTDNLAPVFDQRGRLRAGAHPDAGAFESSEPFSLIIQLRSPIPPNTSITNDGGVHLPDAHGRFILPNLPAGDTVINITGPDTVFRPGSTNLNLEADMVLETRAFLAHAFAWDPDFAGPTYSFAGKATEQWDFFASYNLADWFPAGTHAFAADDVHSIPLDQFTQSVFLKATRR